MTAVTAPIAGLDTTLTPFMRYVGGKRLMAAQLVAEIMATKPVRYVEPMVGGGAVALALPTKLHKIIADVNRPITNIWRCFQKASTALEAQLREYAKQFPNTAFGYAAARDELNSMITKDRPLWVKHAAIALHVNARAFNGIWRTNQAGLFNVPWGKVKNPRVITLAQAHAYAAALSSTEIMLADFRVTMMEAHASGRQFKGTAIFLDPPYDGTFDTYSAGGFDATDQRELAAWAWFAVENGANLWATNADTPFIREIYSWARIESSTENHAVGSTGARRGARACLLIRAGVHG